MRVTGVVLLLLAGVTPAAAQERSYEDVAAVMREHGLLLSAAQQFNHRETGRYAEQLDSLRARLRAAGEVLVPLPGYELEIVAATADGWAGRVRNWSFEDRECVAAVGAVGAAIRTKRGTVAQGGGTWTCDPGPSASELTMRVLRSDLRMFATLQERHYAQARAYARTLGELAEFQPSAGVQFTIERVDGGGWAARAAHSAWPQGDCVMFYGRGAGLRTRGGVEGQVGRAICDDASPR